MEQYQKNVVAERHELNGKLAGLRGFVASPFYTKISQREQDAIDEQVEALEKLVETLDARIALFPPDAPEPLTLVQQIAKEHADHDPYGFKNKGEKAAKHNFQSDPYVYREFPKVLYKEEDTRAVQSKEEFDEAIKDGFSETPSPESANVGGLPVLEPEHVVIEEKGVPVPTQTIDTGKPEPEHANVDTTQEYSSQTMLAGPAADA